MVAITSTNKTASPSSNPVSSGQGSSSKKPTAEIKQSEVAQKTSFAQEISQLPKVQELKTIPIINSGVNASKKVFANLFRLAGFVGASLSVASYFLFNLKSLAVVFGIPTAMAFFIAHTLAKSVKNNQATFSTDPVKILHEAIKKPELLEKDLNRILYAVEQVKDMKDSDLIKSDGKRAIETLNDIVDTKLEQLKALGHEGESDNLALESEYKRFKVAYDEMKDLESIQTALHRPTSV
jgi:hypothetical protein